MSAACPAGPDGTAASNPLNYDVSGITLGNGIGFATSQPAFGFPAGGLGPDNRIAFYVGDSWKVQSNLNIEVGLRYVRDTGRNDSDLPGIPALNNVVPDFPNLGAQIRQPNRNFAPQIGVAWDPTHNGKTVIRAGAGLYYENTIWNNVLFVVQPARRQEPSCRLERDVTVPALRRPLSRSPADRFRFRMEFAAMVRLPSQSAQPPTTSSICCIPTNRPTHSLRLLRTAATSVTS